MDVTSAEDSGETPPEVKLVGEQTPPPAVRDAGSIKPNDWPRQDPPRVVGKRENAFQVIVRQSVLNNTHKHGRSQEVEVCGVLVGDVYHDSRGPYVYVEASIAGASAAGKATQVTFTAETWEIIQREMDRNHAGKKIVGWYHTHPGFGIFLSDMDVFIHENFFGESWQLAYVYDPTAGEDGMFVWRDGKPTREPYLVEQDKKNSDPPELRKAVPPSAAVGGGMTSPQLIADLSARVQAVESRMRLLTVTLVFIALLAVASPVVVIYFMLPQNKPAVDPHAGVDASAKRPGPDWADVLNGAPPGAAAVDAARNAATRPH